MSIRHLKTHSHRIQTCGDPAAVFALLVAISVSGLANAADDAPVTTSGNVAPPVQFLNDVVPLLTRLHCNSGGCHGKATGQNGFKLSLLGFEPDFDYAALVSEARGRRLFPADPNQSLLLTKATGAVPHGGGRRLAVDSDDYRGAVDGDLIHQWHRPVGGRVVQLSIIEVRQWLHD